MRLLEILAKKDDVCSVDGTGKCASDMDFTAFLQSFGGNVITTLFIIAGLMSVIMLIVCGIIMMISNGDPSKVAKAKKGITASIIGLIISLSAFAIATAIANAF